MTGELRVIATAGHVDHGKSALIVALTGIDPDRWAEEKRRGLTIDLGYAWTTLPGGREVGFVDVPGHEKFVRNMLAGVGPVRLVLFVVAADEGWKPQSEEHLQILDVLGVQGAVIALTKRDLVDEETLAIAEEEVRDHVGGTALESAPVIAVSARTGAGMPDLIGALEAMLAAAPAPVAGRPRLFVDRVFTITGAGTVVTGTLEGDGLSVGDEVAIEPGGHVARIRSLQTHKRDEVVATPVSRVAANLAGVERRTIERGDVLTRAGAWRPTSMFDAWLTPVRGLDRIPARGAFTVHAGAEETSATIRLGPSGEDAGRPARVRTAHPLVLQPGDRFVLREDGRRATVGGGVVLDVSPPRAFAAPAHLGFLGRRREAPSAQEVAALLVEERGALDAREVVLATGAEAPVATRVQGWAIADDLRRAVAAALIGNLEGFHRAQPLVEGMPLADARASVRAALRTARAATVDAGLIDALIAHTEGVERTAGTVRVGTHQVDLGGRAEDVERLRAAIGGDALTAPPGIEDLVAAGFGPDLIEAASRAGDVIALARGIVVHPDLVERAVGVIARAETGVTVSALREALGTSRKFAVPLVEWLDAQGRTRREGDLRFLR